MLFSKDDESGLSCLRFDAAFLAARTVLYTPPEIEWCRVVFVHVLHCIEHVPIRLHHLNFIIAIIVINKLLLYLNRIRTIFILCCKFPLSRWTFTLDVLPRLPLGLLGLPSTLMPPLPLPCVPFSLLPSYTTFSPLPAPYIIICFCNFSKPFIGP